MRKISLILFIILSFLVASAQDTLTVMAKSGVFLRSKADVKSASLKKVAYGEKVITLLDSFNSEGFVFKKPIGIEFIDLANELEKLLKLKVDLVSKNGIRPQYMKQIEQELSYV